MTLFVSEIRMRTAGHFTMLEMVVALCIVLMFSAAFLTQFIPKKDEMTLEEHAEKLQSLMLSARMEAVRSASMQHIEYEPGNRKWIWTERKSRNLPVPETWTVESEERIGIVSNSHPCLCFYSNGSIGMKSVLLRNDEGEQIRIQYSELTGKISMYPVSGEKNKVNPIRPAKAN